MNEGKEVILYPPFNKKDFFDCDKIIIGEEVTLEELKAMIKDETI